MLQLGRHGVRSAAPAPAEGHFSHLRAEVSSLSLHQPAGDPLPGSVGAQPCRYWRKLLALQVSSLERLKAQARCNFCKFPNVAMCCALQCCNYGDAAILLWQALLHICGAAMLHNRNAAMLWNMLTMLRATCAKAAAICTLSLKQQAYKGCAPNRGWHRAWKGCMQTSSLQRLHFALTIVCLDQFAPGNYRRRHMLS